MTDFHEMNDCPPVGLILAGGAGQRVGGADKARLRWRDRRLIDHVADRLAPQVGTIWVARRAGMDRLGSWRTVIDAEDATGPLAGIVAGLAALAAEGLAWMLTAPVDTPMLPRSLGARLWAARDEVPLVVAHDGQRDQPLCALWHSSLHHRVSAQAAQDPTVRACIAAIPHRRVAIPVTATDRFLNLNRPEDYSAKPIRS